MYYTQAIEDQDFPFLMLRRSYTNEPDAHLWRFSTMLVNLFFFSFLFDAYVRYQCNRKKIAKCDIVNENLFPGALYGLLSFSCQL